MKLICDAYIFIYIKVIDVRHVIYFVGLLALFAFLANCYEKNEKSMVPK